MLSKKLGKITIKLCLFSITKTSESGSKLDSHWELGQEVSERECASPIYLVKNYIKKDTENSITVEVKRKRNCRVYKHLGIKSSVTNSNVCYIE